MIDHDLVLLLHQDRLREAEKKRFIRQYGRRPSRFGKPLPARIGELLIALGGRMKAGAAGRIQPHPPLNRLDLWSAR